MDELLTSAGFLAEAERADPELLGGLALIAGRSALKRGALEVASDLFDVAAACLVVQADRRDLAGQLIALARAYDKQRPGEGENGEKSLRVAAALDPLQGCPAYARYLQRRKRLSEAIDQWQEAIRANPQESNHYLGLGHAYEQIGRPEAALGSYLALIDAAPTGRNYLVIAQRLDKLAPSLPPAPGTTVRVALLGNATLDHLQSYLKVECYRTGFRPEVYQSGFDQYTQDIMNPQSDLYSFSPEIVVCSIHASRLFPSIHQYPFELTVEQRQGEIDDGLRSVQNLLDALTERSTALVLVHNMVSPQYPALGILDSRDTFGQAEMFGQINARMAALARDRYKNVYIVDEDRIQTRSGKATATDPRLWLTARIPWSDGVLTGLAQEYIRYLIPHKGRSRKCIVLDLDNTLWGGVIGEDGLAGIQIGPDAPGNAYLALQQELERLWKRGILLAVCSKNNEDDVLPVFEQHAGMLLKKSHFAAMRINWRSKAENIGEIASELNIGLDSLVFLDDNPVERARVRAELPQVLTPELPTDAAYYRRALAELTVFDTLALTEEDRKRNQLYAEQRARREFETSESTAAGSLTDYLAALEMVVEIEPLSEQTLPRIAQLTNKTNQFNLTTRRYSEGQITAMNAAGCEIYGARVADRFGDNGLVGVAILRPSDNGTRELDTLLLSCRVMGRGVETALLSFLADRTRGSGATRLQGWYLPTAKNSPVKDCYSQHGFSLVQSGRDGSDLWELDLATSDVAVPEWLTVRVPAAV